MLELRDAREKSIGRRDFLRIGSLGTGGLSLPWLLRARSAAAASSQYEFVRDKAVIVVYCGGGASHIETFNPNMDARAPHRSVVGEIKTALPGITFGSPFPQLARMAGRLAVVRSFQHSVADHTAAMSHVLTGGTDPNGARRKGYSLGSAYARLRGASYPETGMPSYAVLITKEIDGPGMRQQARFLGGSRPGTLGPAYAPFNPTGEGSASSDMELRLPAARIDDRLRLLKNLDRLQRRLDTSGAIGAMDRFQQQALDVIFGGVREAFDLSQEDPRVVERYDTSRFMVGYEKFRPATLGKRLLVARRLCQAGCGFVTVHFDGWDNHGGNRPGITDGMQIHGPPLDKAVSALLEDLAAQGLTDKILVVVTGDFGRTPKINSKGGRDHWPQLSTLALAGGGLQTPAVIGRSDRQNAAPATEPVTLDHLCGTIFHTLFDAGTLRTARGLPTEVLRRITSQEPIPGLM